MFRGAGAPGNRTAGSGKIGRCTGAGEPAGRDKASSLGADVESHMPRGVASGAVHGSLHGITRVRQLEREEERVVAPRAAEVQASDGHASEGNRGRALRMRVRLRGPPAVPSPEPAPTKGAHGGGPRTRFGGPSSPPPHP